MVRARRGIVLSALSESASGQQKAGRRTLGVRPTGPVGMIGMREPPTAAERYWATVASTASYRSVGSHTTVSGRSVSR